MFKSSLLFVCTFPGIIFFIIFLFLFFKNKKIYVFLSLLFLYLFTTTTISRPIISFLENKIKSSCNENISSVAVLGGGIKEGSYKDDNSKIGDRFLKRIIKAVELSKSQKKFNKLIILGGNILKEEIPESAHARKIIISFL